MSELQAASTQVEARYASVMMNTFGPPKRVFVRGEGCYLWDADGNRYLDLLAGIAVNCLGHAHPQLTGAISSQLGTLGHVSNFFATPNQVALAERLVSMVTINDPGRLAKVFFANSGTEANEAAFKVSRMTGRKKLVAMEGAFHGRTLGALAITYTAKYREPFEPLPGYVEFVPYGDAEALARAVDSETAAVVIEPIQGENGVVEPPSGFLAAAREICDKAGALLWLDEVQCGMGRTGTWLASEPEGIVADVVTFAKGLGGGFPIGACVATGAAADLLGPGTHGSTFGGNPVAAAAGLAVTSVIERDGLLAHATALGEHVKQALEDVPGVYGVRGRGLMLGVVLEEPIGAAVYERALEAGFVINSPRPDVLRLVPPLIISQEQVDTFIDALPGLLR